VTWSSTAAALAAAWALTGCFTTAADFGNDAESFILTNDDLRDALFADTDVTFETATCVEPDSQDEGTTFPCTGIDSTGATWEFEVVITGSSEYEVNLSRAPTG